VSSATSTTLAARTEQMARKSTGSKEPRKQLAVNSTGTTTSMVRTGQSACKAPTFPSCNSTLLFVTQFTTPRPVSVSNPRRYNSMAYRPNLLMAIPPCQRHYHSKTLIISPFLQTHFSFSLSFVYHWFFVTLSEPSQSPFSPASFGYYVNLVCVFGSM
jgi:hypothetical protein